MGSDNRTNPRRAAREARAHSRELGILYRNLFGALEDWEKFHGMSDEEMQDWCVTVLKYHWTRNLSKKLSTIVVCIGLPIRTKEQVQKTWWQMG